MPPVIGVLDSGVGGLSVLRQIHDQLPMHPTLYFADQAHLPYGPRPAAEVRAYVEAAADHLITHGAAVIVLACHAASAAALLPLREQYPAVPIVGIEPAIKPAVEATKTGIIGVLTTQTTANGPLYARVLSRYAGDIQVITQVAPQLVSIVEENSADTPHSRQIIAEAVQPFIEAGADHLVLACTHFPFLADAIAVCAPKITLIDPAPAVARQVTRVWPPALHPASTPNQYFTSGDPARFSQMLKHLLGIEALALHVSP